jgi:hypothetical protein
MGFASIGLCPRYRSLNIALSRSLVAETARPNAEPKIWSTELRRRCHNAASPRSVLNAVYLTMNLDLVRPHTDGTRGRWTKGYS